MSERTRQDILGFCEILGSISDWIVRIPLARAVADHDAIQRQRIAQLEAEVARLNRTVEFQASAYLKDHEHWGECKWKAEAQWATRSFVFLAERHKNEISQGEVDRAQRILNGQL